MTKRELRRDIITNAINQNKVPISFYLSYVLGSDKWVLMTKDELQDIMIDLQNKGGYKELTDCTSLEQYAGLCVMVGDKKVSFVKLTDDNEK